MRPLTFQRARLWIGFSFLVLLAVCVAFLFMGLQQGMYYPDELRLLLIALAKLFAPNVALVIGALLAPVAKPIASRRVSAQVFAVAMGSILIWAVIVVGRIAIFVVDDSPGDSVDELNAFMDSVPEAFGFLVTAALAFFFARESQGR